MPLSSIEIRRRIEAQRFVATRQRASELRALIAEHEA